MLPMLRWRKYREGLKPGTARVAQHNTRARAAIPSSSTREMQAQSGKRQQQTPNNGIRKSVSARR